MQHRQTFQLRTIKLTENLRSVSLGHTSWHVWNNVVDLGLTLGRPSYLCASHFQPRASPRANPRAYPGHLKKLFKCPALRAIFVGKCPAPRSYYDGSLLANARSPSPSDQYTKLLVAIFNKHNCFSSVELYKTGHEMSHSDSKKAKQMVFLLL